MAGSLSLGQAPAERGAIIKAVATVPTISISAPCPKTKVARQALIDYMSSHRLSNLEAVRRQIETGRFDPTGVPTDVLWGLVLTGLIQPAAPSPTVASKPRITGVTPASPSAARTSSARPKTAGVTSATPSAARTSSASKPPQASSQASSTAPVGAQVTGVSQGDWARLVGVLDRDVQQILDLAQVRVDQASRQITLM